MVMETNRYAPPKAAVADRAEPLLKRRRIVMMLVFTVMTLGWLSGLVTFFFGILYLQWAINRYHDRLTQSEYEPEAAAGA